MDDLAGVFDELMAFVAVVDAGGFNAAGERFGLPPSRLSRAVAALERKLGVSLLVRSSRRFSVTEVGWRTYERAVDIRARLQGTVAEASDSQGEVSGHLRVSCPMALAAALVGSLVGFLRYNWHPAKIYMGDTGAMFIGLMLGALSMIGQYAAQQDLALLSPVFILGVPIFDTLFVMYVRYRRGLPMFLGSPDHMPLRLRRWGLSVTQVVTVSYAASAVFGGLGVLLIFAGRQAALAICVLSGAAALAAAYVLLRVDTRTPLAVASDPAPAVPATRKARSA